MTAVQRLAGRVRLVSTPQLLDVAAQLERRIRALPVDQRRPHRIAWQAVTRELLARGAIKVED